MPYITCQQIVQHCSNSSRTLQPVGQRHLQATGLTDLIHSSLMLDCGGRRHVKRNTEIAFLRADFVQRSDAREAGHVGEVAVGGDDALDVVVGKKTLRAFTIRRNRFTIV